MNITIKNRKLFNELLKLLKTEEVKVVDTETNGLKMYAGNHLISLSIFFPVKNKVFNVAFLHGVGEVEVKWTDKFPEGTPFNKLTWQGKAKKQIYLSYWFTKFKAEQEDNYFENLPIEWLDELKAAWGTGTYILHNSRFDAHVLYAAGFPDMAKVYDTMIALHIVQEDWRHIEFDNLPYTWSKANAPSPELAGNWATNTDGTLARKTQLGNRQLKWQSAAWGFKDATAGETSLSAAIRALQQTLTDYIMENIYDPMNESLLIAKVVKGTASEDDWAKQREKIEAKVEIDDKANLWMLPSGLVSYYAELDVLLTWDLYNWALKIIKQWNNEDLFEKQSLIHHKVAWEMERNGFKLDREAAQAQIDLLTPRIEELGGLLSRLAMEWGIEYFSPNSPMSLLKFLNSGVLGQEFHSSIFPSWWDVGLTLNLKTYGNTYISEAETEEQGEELFGTDKRELEKVEDHAVVRMVKELRKMNKSVNTYLKKWLAAADEDGIVRFSVNDDGTVAGRASSSGDAGNGQNIPDRGGYTIKKAVVPYGADWRLLAVDYDQLELRLGAWIGEGLLGLDNNMTMTNLFLSGEDMHSYVRDMIGVREILYSGLQNTEIAIKLGYSLSSDAVNTPEKLEETVSTHLRQVAKTMNFGLLYSGGKVMLSKLLKIDENVAEVLVRKWRKLFPAFPRTQTHISAESIVSRLRPDGLAYAQYYTQPITGRHRKLQLYKTGAWYTLDGQSVWYNPKLAAAGKVWNNTVQGLGGFIAMYSAYRIGEELGRDRIKMFVGIHDALEMNIHVDSLHLLPDILRIMSDWPDVLPKLTATPQGSTDGTWQGMGKINQLTRWIATQGNEGMKNMKDHYGRTIYKWSATVTHGDISYNDVAYGIDPGEAEEDLERQAKTAYKREVVKVVILKRDEWVKM